MTASELYRQAVALGLRLEPRGDKLAVAPAGRVPDFADVLRQHKAELLDWPARPPCPGWQAVPPADLALGPLRPDLAPAPARRVVEFIVRQLGAGLGPLCEWCLKRELAYWNTYPKFHGCGAVFTFFRV